MTQIPARADVPAGALELLGEKGGAERALTAALASFQEQVQAVPSLDLAAVVEAARPAFAQGIAFSSQLVDLVGPLFTADLGATGVHHRDPQQ